jgi:hypothetical protein
LKVFHTFALSFTWFLLLSLGVYSLANFSSYLVFFHLPIFPFHSCLSGDWLLSQDAPLWASFILTFEILHCVCWR